MKRIASIRWRDTQKRKYLIYDDEVFDDFLEKAGYQVEVFYLNKLKENDLYKTINWKKYDYCEIQTCFNALWVASYMPKTILSYILKEIGKGIIHLSDTTIPLEHKFFDKGKSDEKINIFKLVPFKVVASFSEEIKKDDKALDRLNKIWFNRFNEDSEHCYINWLVNFISFKDILLDDYKLEKQDKNLVYNNYYYGMNKNKLISSLLDLGLGSNENDLVSGSIQTNKKLLNVANTEKDGFFVKYALQSKNILFPYEPIKNDYQITPRLLETLLVYKDKVLFDSRVPNYLKEFACNEKIWLETLDSEVEKMRNSLKK